MDEATNIISSCTFSVTVRDCEPPVIHSVTASPDVLWPPNHQLQQVVATINVTDDKDPHPTVKLVSITSSEPDNGLGDGDTPNDQRPAIRSHARIVITTRQAEGRAVAVEIEDNGKGISPENLPRIFDPFFTTKEVGAGTGLGLSITYSIVKEHGGEISLVPSAEGATFEVEFPFASEEAVEESLL